MENQDTFWYYAGYSLLILGDGYNLEESAISRSSQSGKGQAGRKDGADQGVQTAFKLRHGTGVNLVEVYADGIAKIIMGHRVSIQDNIIPDNIDNQVLWCHGQRERVG